MRYFLIVQHAASSLDFSNLITLLLSKTDKKLTNWTDRLSNIPKCTTSFGESPRSTYTVHRVTPKKIALGVLKLQRCSAAVHILTKTDPMTQNFNRPIIPQNQLMITQVIPSVC